MSEASLTRYATAWEALQMGWEDIQCRGLHEDGFVVRVMETATGWAYYFWSADAAEPHALDDVVRLDRTYSTKSNARRAARRCVIAGWEAAEPVETAEGIFAVFRPVSRFTAAASPSTRYVSVAHEQPTKAAAAALGKAMERPGIRACEPQLTNPFKGYWSPVVEIEDAAPETIACPTGAAADRLAALWKEYRTTGEHPIMTSRMAARIRATELDVAFSQPTTDAGIAAMLLLALGSSNRNVVGRCVTMVLLALHERIGVVPSWLNTVAEWYGTPDLRSVPIVKSATAVSLAFAAE